MDGVTIYYELIGQGRKVSAQDDKLKIRPSQGLTEAMKEAVRTHKAEILAAMQEAEELDELLSLGDGLWEPDWRQRLEARRVQAQVPGGPDGDGRDQVLVTI